jgi:hypothetical protein
VNLFFIHFQNRLPKAAGYFKDILMKHSLEHTDDDDAGYADDGLQQDNETQSQGARFVKKKYGSTVDHTTVSANPLDADMLPVPESEQERIEVRRGKKVEDDKKAESTLRRLTDSETAKQQVKDKLSAASKGFDFSLLDTPKKAANDNFRPTVSWPLMDQLTRRTFEPDRERRAKNVVSARYLRELIDTVGADALGNDNDGEVQRTESGNAWFEHGQTLDRKKVIYDNKNGEADAERYSGSVRTANKSGPVSNSGFDVNRDEPFPVRVMAAREELAVIIAAVGPLWPSLFAAISKNATMTDIGLALGVKRFQAPREGTAIIRRALTAAMEALSRFNEVKDVPRQTTPLPVKSRGSFLNQAGGPVIKVAA